MLTENDAVSALFWAASEWPLKLKLNATKVQKLLYCTRAENHST